MEDLIQTVLSAPVEIIAGGAMLLLLLFALMRIRSRKRRAGRRSDRRSQWVEDAAAGQSTETGDAAPLPRITAYPMPVIGLIEERVFDELEDIASQSIMGHRVLTQLSLSAFLYAGSSGYSRADEMRVAAHLASLQVDFLIVDADWQPVVAVNIERDAQVATDTLETVREICGNAGVAYLVVDAEGLPGDRRDEIARLLVPKKGMAAQ